MVSINNSSWSASMRFVAGFLAAFAGLTILALWAGQYKVVGISWIAFTAMALAIPLGKEAEKHQNTNRLIITYAICAGAMITSALLFLAPAAINQNPWFGGFGMAAGIAMGFLLDGLNGVITRRYRMDVDSVVIELSLHTLAAGLVIGIIYAAMPRLSWVLGVAIVSHKAPAGYAAARRLASRQKNAYSLLIPAAAIGVTALLTSLLHITANGMFIAGVFGIATGVFFHIGASFLPAGNKGGSFSELGALSYRQQLRAVIFAAGGGLAVTILWLVIK